MIEMNINKKIYDRVKYALTNYPKTSALIRSPLQAYGAIVAPDFVSGE